MKAFVRSRYWSVLFSVVGLACGSQGPAGSAGPTGPQGVQGAQGPQGQQGPQGTSPDAGSVVGAVYTTSNDPAGNEVFVYSRRDDGSLTELYSFSTGGLGTGAGLGDQGALAFDPSTKTFFAVNAGDNSLSALALNPDGTLSLLSHVPSGGSLPLSVTVSNGVVYALNAGSTLSDGGVVSANISGFQLQAGALSPLSASTQALSAPLPGPAQVGFTPDGKHLVVSEKGTQTIDTFAVDASGTASEAKSQASAGSTPFGFGFSADGHLLVTEAGPNAVSSYAVGADGTLSADSTSVPTHQIAPCWMAASGTWGYAVDAHSNTLTGYSVAADGTLTALNASGVTGTTGDTPLDDAITPDGAYLYVLNSHDRSISSFHIDANGSLAKQPDTFGLPAAATGLVAR